MRTMFTFALTTITVAALALVAAPSALASSKNHPSSNLPWVIGAGVVVVILLALLLLRMRNGMSKRDVTANGRFRRP
jgi:hypothetical protein